MKVLFMESQKREKIKTCLHFHFPTRLASYPLTWYNDEKISARPWPGLRAGKGCGEVWEGEVQDRGHDFADSKAFSQGANVSLHPLAMP